MKCWLALQLIALRLTATANKLRSQLSNAEMFVLAENDWVAPETSANFKTIVERIKEKFGELRSRLSWL